MVDAPAKILWVRGEAKSEPLGRVFDEAGFLVRAVGTAFEALQLASWPDVILLDGRPGDRSAGEVYQSLRIAPATAGIPILLLCRGDCPGGPEKAAPLPCACSTPDPEQIVRRIETLVDHRRSSTLDGLEPAAPPAVPAEGTDGGPSVPARWTLEGLGLLAVGVAHDFKNLLTVILGHASLVAEHFESASPARELLGNLETAALRASDLASQVLTFACRKPVGVRTVNVNCVIEETARFLRRSLGSNIEFAIDLDPGDPALNADPGHLTQVLLNLCLNARDAMPRGGRLCVRTAAVTLTANDVPAHSGGRVGRFVRLQVCDTGAGMTPEVRRNLFEWFATSKPPDRGSGVGLATVHRIVQQYRGWIECSSEPECGTCFDVYLPQA